MHIEMFLKTIFVCQFRALKKIYKKLTVKINESLVLHPQ